MYHRAALLSSFAWLLAGAAGAADGLQAPDGQDLWPQWQARITVNSTSLTPVSLTGAADGAAAQRGALQFGALVGDYYFDAPGLRLPLSLGGLRATGGLTAGSRGLSWSTAGLPRAVGAYGLSLRGPAGMSPTAEPAADTLPYLGVGYTGISAKGGWGFSADLGLVAGFGAAGQSRSVFGSQSLDSAVRDLRLSPVLQLGVSYAF